MPQRPTLLRILVLLAATGIGFVAGLAIGGFAEAFVIPAVLFVTGHPHPLQLLDDSFKSRPMGTLAHLMVAGYLTTAFLGAFASYRATRNRLSQHWPLRPPPENGRVK